MCVYIYIYIYRLPRWLSSGLENPMDREARQATVHGIAKGSGTSSALTISYMVKTFGG